MALTATFTVRLDQVTTRIASMAYATAGDTAVSGVDFTPVSGTLTFQPGDLYKLVRVTVLADPALQVNKKFKLVLSNPVNCTLPSSFSNWCVVSTASGTDPNVPVDNPTDPDVPTDPTDNHVPTTGQALRVLPTTVDFGTDHVEGVTVTQVLTLINDGTVPLDVNSLSTAAPFSALLPGPVTIPVSATLPLNVAFTQDATTGEQTGTLTIVSGAPSPLVVPLQANSTATVDPNAYELTVASPFAFGDQATLVPVTLPITVQNTGSSPNTISGLVATTPFSVTFTTPIVIAAGASTTINVTYTPGATLGAETGTLAITSLAPVKTVALTGTSVVAAAFGPLIKNGLITNAYQNVLGRDGYFSEVSGTSEGQSLMILASFLVQDALAGGTTDEQAASAWFNRLGLQMLDALGNGTNTSPMLRQPIPSDPTTITMLHWLFAARGPVPLQAYVLDYQANLSGGVLTIPSGAHGADVFRVWQVYPAAKELLYDSPFSPVVGGGGIVPDSYATSGSITTVHVTAADGPYKVVYGYRNAGTLPEGRPYEAYPVWNALEDGYVACAPDTFRWFEQAITQAITHDTRSGKSAAWTNLRAAMRRTAVRGQNLSDLRDVFVQLPGIGVFDPSGMFSYSDRPGETANGPNPAWSGYNWWTRDTNGDIIANFPVRGDLNYVGQAQLGRGIEDVWRVATPYQDADQFLYVEASGNFSRVSHDTTDPTGALSVFLSATREYDPAQRWVANISLGDVSNDAGLDADDPRRQWHAVATPGGTSVGGDVPPTGGKIDTEVIGFLIARRFFKSIADNSILPAGTQILNFGITDTVPFYHQIRLRRMRLLSGASEAAVRADVQTAALGSQLPYFPGAMPFATNANLVAQQFVGYAGNPFHGYQLSDLWLDLGAEAGAVHGALVPGKLPIPNSVGTLTHPISATNPNGSTKPQNLLLMEQQLSFLRDAQAAWVARGGTQGPFAHTFVLNTPARANIGNPPIHTWVYTNDDPNTRWTGYQCRVVESLGMLLLRTGSITEAQTVRTMAYDMLNKWLTFLNTIWPDVSGKPYTDPTLGAITVYGLPTEYPDPTISAPITGYEEPHAAALVLRACLNLRMSNYDPSSNALADALMVRCWTYLEKLWVTTGDMAGTWSGDPVNHQWYGFHNAEILITLARLIGDGAASRPSAIDPAIVRQRIMSNFLWLHDTGVKPSLL
jgi:hypothetical protein